MVLFKIKRSCDGIFYGLLDILFKIVRSTEGCGSGWLAICIGQEWRRGEERMRREAGGEEEEAGSTSKI